MPSNRTHRPVGSAGAAVTCAAIGLPIVWWLVMVTAATVASPWPDKLEKVPRALWRRVRPWEVRASVRLADLALNGTPDTSWRVRRDRALVKLDRLLRKLQVHRRWTHYVFATGVPIAVIVGAAALGALAGAATLLLMAAEGIAPDRQMTIPGEAWGWAAWIAIFAAFGAFVGYALHSYLDGWTEMGSPMLGPWCDRRLHVIPKWFAKRRARRGEEPWINADDEATLRKWAPRVIVASVALHFRADLWPIVVVVYDAARAALA